MDVRKLWHRAPGAGVFELHNPHASIWRSEPPDIRRKLTLGEIDFKRFPMFFVHGMSFRTPLEVVTDFLIPFERQARIFGKSERSDFQVLFVHWDSHIFSHDIQSFIDSHFPKVTAPLLKLATVPLVTEFVRELEERATLSVEHVFPLLRDWLLYRGAPRPWLITHSLGSYFWSQIAARLVREQDGCETFGNWWNLQAAVKADAYSAGGEFAELENVYHGRDDARITLWHSKRDFVLSTFYRWAKGIPAAGQVGLIGAPYIHHRDVTDTAIEAHGLQTLRPAAGHFFDRVGQAIFRDSRLTNPAISV